MFSSFVGFSNGQGEEKKVSEFQAAFPVGTKVEGVYKGQKYSGEVDYHTDEGGIAVYCGSFSFKLRKIDVDYGGSYITLQVVK